MYSDIEITKREILSSIVIVLVMLILGLFIHSKIQQNTYDNNEVYYKALKIDNNAEMFNYNMQTNVGNAFVSGSFSGVDTVSYPAVQGEYLYISKETQEYTKHTRTVTYTDEDGEPHTETETYWTWDTVKFEEKRSNNILFENVLFETSKFKLPSPQYLLTERKGFSDIRYIYYGVNSNFTGTILANLKDNTIFNIENEKHPVTIYTSNLQDTYEQLLNSGIVVLVFFWIVWVVLMGIVVYDFFIFENKWLE